MVDMNKKAGKGTSEAMENKPAKKSKRSSSGAGNAGISTATKTNGGTRSSPPRVGGNGGGEAEGEKAKSASVARQKAAEPNAETASTSSRASAGSRNTSKRDTR